MCSSTNMANSCEYICLPSGLSLTEFKVFHTSLSAQTFVAEKEKREKRSGDDDVVVIDVVNYCRVELLLNCMVARI